jgi:hypothetical protein
VTSSRHARWLPAQGAGHKAGPHTLRPAPRPGREDLRREEITTELAPTRGNDWQDRRLAVTGPSNVGKH